MTIATVVGFIIGVLIAHLIWNAAETIATWKDTNR